ncbi:MAG: sodium/solute symporter [Candidatus Neomarinimicrobiota bacterium]|nr:sodium/solute symporter [Candidatus Neomarinimicrobiota bacterium]
MVLGPIDYTIIIIYLVGTVVFGAYIGRKIKSGKDYFLAGRSLPWWAIGMSLVVSDIGAVDMVGIAGSAYLYGIVLGNYDWLGSVPVMIIAAFLFIPMFWKKKVSTIPEWLGARYNSSVQTTSALIWGIYMPINLGIILYASAVMLNVLLDLDPKVLILSDDKAVVEKVAHSTDTKKYDFIYASSIDKGIQLSKDRNPIIVFIDKNLSAESNNRNLFTGIPFVSFTENEISSSWGEINMNRAREPDWDIFYSILIMGIVIGVYTFLGGLRAVVYTDVIQCVVMLGGSLFVLFFGIIKLGGVSEFVNIITSMGERTKDHFSLVLPVDTKTPHPWSGILFGLGFVLANAYWIGNQSIVQRSLGARSMADAKASYIFGALLKILIPFAMVVPGIISLAYNPDIADADKAMATLIKEIMPTGLIGIFFAAFLAGLMSSVDSFLNSAATVWTTDIYKKYFRPKADDAHYLVVGRVFTIIFILVAIYVAQFATGFESLYDLAQTLLSFFQGPSLAIIILGVLWKRATGTGALVGLIGGISFSALLMWVHSTATIPLFQVSEPFLYVALWSFILSIMLTVFVSLYTKQEPEEKLRGMVYRYD